jgi:hypothetical protein
MTSSRIETIHGAVASVATVDDYAIAVAGRIPRIARVRDEPWDCISDPDDFVKKLRRARLGADIFTFSQQVADSQPLFKHYFEWDHHAVVHVSTYDHWWTKQLDTKSRNMIRKAAKCGVELRVVPFDEQLVRGIVDIYNETPIRQGKPFWHYGKGFDEIWRDHATFLSRSQFVGAFHNDRLIGFAKLVESRDALSLMQIISMISERDKAPSNALIAKSVEICAASNVRHLHYGVWSTGGLGLFKTSHAFVRHQVPRYFVPLNPVGHLLLKAGLHRKWTSKLPEGWIDRLAPIRAKWNAIRHGAAAKSAPIGQPGHARH